MRGGKHRAHPVIKERVKGDFGMAVLNASNSEINIVAQRKIHNALPDGVMHPEPNARIPSSETRNDRWKQRCRNRG
jgi:hypothetical protein